MALQVKFLLEPSNERRVHFSLHCGDNALKEGDLLTEAELVLVLAFGWGSESVVTKNVTVSNTEWGGTVGGVKIREGEIEERDLGIRDQRFAGIVALCLPEA